MRVHCLLIAVQGACVKRLAILILLCCSAALAQKASPSAVVKVAAQEVENTYVDLSAHQQEWTQAKKTYAGKRYQSPAAAHKAIEEMLRSLQNSRLTWLSQTDVKTILAQFSSPVPQLGLTYLSFEFLPGEKKIITPLATSAAAAAGVRTGDILESVNGTRVTDQSAGELVRLLKTAGGKPAELVVTRNNASQTIEVNPASAPLKYVSWTGQPHGTAEITLREFAVPAIQEFRDAMTAAAKLQPSDYVIDIRMNPGGLLDVARDIASMFISDKEFSCSKDAAGKSTCRKLKESKPVGEPVTLLVDEGTASAAEIFAVAFQRAARGQVIGCKTYGHGLGAQLSVLPDGSALLIPDSSYLDPQGQPIEGRGVTPDVVKCPAF